jgi:tripartite-type tricarboxylate transporter receptor subunit TctC
MGIHRRKFLTITAGALAVPAFAHLASAQSYPTHPIRLLVGYPAGGQIDIVARLTAQFLSEQLGQSMVVENRPGAGGSLGAEAVIKAPPDGYTLFMGASSNAVDVSLLQNLSFDFVRDIAPIAPVNRINLILEANPTFPVTSVAELIAQAKANPGKIDIASPSIGTPPYMAVELLKPAEGRHRRHLVRHRPHPLRQAPGAGADDGQPHRRIARRSDHRRNGARLRGQRLERPGRAQGHAACHRGSAL